MPGDKSAFRSGFEVAEGVPGPESWFQKFENESFSRMNPTSEASPNIDGSGNELETKILKMEGSGNVQAVANSESWLPWRVHQHGFYVAPTTPAAGVRLWELRDRDEINEAEIAHWIDTLFVGVWKDEDTLPSEWFGMGLKVSEFELAVDANSFVRFNHTGLFLRERYVKTPTAQVPDATFDGTIHVRGHDSQDAEYRKLRFTGGALDGTNTVQFGLGGGAYGVAAYPVVARTWMDVYNADGTLAGPPDQNLQIYIDDTTDETIANLTEYRILPQAPKPVPVYTGRPDLTSTRCQVRILKSGVTPITRDVEGGLSLKMGTPREAKMGVGTLFGTRIRKPTESRKWWEFSFNTTYLDRELVQAMTRGTPFEVFIEVRGELIGSSGLYDYASFLLPAMKITQAGANVASAGDLPENPVFRAFPETQGASLCVEKYQNTIVDIDPTTGQGIS